MRPIPVIGEAIVLDRPPPGVRSYIATVSGVTSSGARAERDRRGAVEAVAEIDQLERVARRVAIQQAAQVGEPLRPGGAQGADAVAPRRPGPLGPPPRRDRPRAPPV